MFQSFPIPPTELSGRSGPRPAARSPAHSPGSSPRSFSPVRRVRPPVGIPASHLPVEAECSDPGDQTLTSSQH
ncbi:hypothetical protein ILYODFUR_035265 [Ilyodon furcidens]|uniref:Uncharacterized protein n=1 Tax=Ilyodon furcidens TaxID=33524 RepID=A0ABV0U0D1_9TELE